VNLAKPEIGLVINYSYLWHREAEQGQVEGRKDRPCAVILTAKGDRVVVLPITHTTPPPGSKAIEIPIQVKRPLGLDTERSWIITSEFNVFKWPGFDLRPINRRIPDKIAYGMLPPGILKTAKQALSKNAHDKSLKQVERDDDAYLKSVSAQLERFKERPATTSTKKDDRLK